MPSDEIKIDLAYKKLDKKEFTTPEKSWHEEFPGKGLNIKFADIWLEEIPQIPPSSSTSVVAVEENLILTEDITVANNKSWYACSTPGDLNTRLRDFIQPDENITKAYYIKLYDSNNKQIFVGDSVNWEFNYADGILTFENSPTNYSAPFKISGYRYIGKKGSTDEFVTNLDRAYDGENGSGSGRVINVDFGPVQLSPSSGSAALQIDSQDYTPVNGLADGQIINRAGILYIYDNTRGKWLSMVRQSIIFGIKRADGCYLNVSDFSSSMSGWPALRDGVITGITVQASSGFSSKSFILSINNNPSPVLSFSLSGLYYANGALNIDFDANDVIKILASSQYGITYNVVANLEISWRV